MRISQQPRSASQFERGMWLFTRFSGLGLLLFGAFSMGVAFILSGRTQLDMPGFMRSMFFPNPNHVVNSDIPDLTAGWSNAFWQIYCTLMFFVAAVHGFNGLRMVLEDYIENPLLVSVLRTLIFLSLLAAVLFAIYVILAS